MIQMLLVLCAKQRPQFSAIWEAVVFCLSFMLGSVANLKVIFLDCKGVFASLLFCVCDLST